MKRKIPWLAIAAIALTLLCLAVIILGVLGYIKLDNRIHALEPPTCKSTDSDLQKTIDFLKDQMQILIWILGVIIAGTGAILAFLGLNTRKSIKDEYKRTYSKLVAARDAEVFKKRIVFLYQDKDHEKLREFQREMRDIGYNISVTQVSNIVTVSKLPDVAKASIVVYTPNDKDDYKCRLIANYCEKEHKHCVLYCPEFDLPRNSKDDLVNKMNEYLYLSISKQIAKLRESLYTLLYLSPFTGHVDATD